MRTILSACLALFTLIGWTGCEDLSPPDADTTRVVVSLSTIPTDVQCVRITAVGPSRTVLREIEVTGGESLTETMTALPVGMVTFTGDAFTAICDKVSKSTIPAWVSEPVPVNVTAGRLASVALTMYRNGRAKVAVDFVDEQPAADAGQPDSATDR